MRVRLRGLYNPSVFRTKYVDSLLAPSSNLATYEPPCVIKGCQATKLQLLCWAVLPLMLAFLWCPLLGQSWPYPVDVEWWTLLRGEDRQRAQWAEITPDGGIIIAGLTRPPDISVTNSDGYVAKLNSQGNIQWAITYGAAGYWEWPRCVKPCLDGGYILVGNTSYARPWRDYGIHVIKLDAEGNILWALGDNDPITALRCEGQASSAWEVVQDGSGAFWIVGESLGDVLVVKIEQDGTVLWCKRFGDPGCNLLSPDCDTGRGILATPEGNIIVVATKGDTEYSDTGRLWLLMLDSTGKVVFDRTYGEPGQYDDPLAMVLASDGGVVILTGQSTAQGNRLALLKVGSSWDLEWIVPLDEGLVGLSVGWGVSLSTTSTGDYLIYGSLADSTKQVLARLGRDGTIVWKTILNYGTSSTGGIYSSCARESPDGGILTIGHTRLTWQLFGPYDEDICIIKYYAPGLDRAPSLAYLSATEYAPETGRAKLYLQYPPDQDLAEVVLVRREDRYPIDQADGEIVWRDWLAGPLWGVQIECSWPVPSYCAAFARDKAGNWNQSVVPGKNALFLGCGENYPPQPLYQLNLTAATLPGGSGGRTSVLLDWWLGPVPQTGGRPPERDEVGRPLGIDWSELPDYGFSLYRNDIQEPIFRITFASDGNEMKVLLSQPGNPEPAREDLKRDPCYAMWLLNKVDLEGRRRFPSFQGLFDPWTEYEDYNVNEGKTYTYRVVLWKGSESCPIASSDPVSIKAGQFAWGVVLRDDARYGDEPIPDQLDVGKESAGLWQLAANGLEFCKFWMHGHKIEPTPDSFPWDTYSDVLVVDWSKDNPDVDPNKYEAIVQAYAFPELHPESMTQWGGDDPWNTESQNFLNSYDSVVERLNSKGVSPFPWIGHLPTMPNFWRVTFGSDEYFTRVYIHTRAAARRYRYGLRKVPIWNLENELNWAFVHVAVGWRSETEYLDPVFLTKVLRVLHLAVKHENMRDLRWNKPVTYARSTTNFNIHVQELKDLVLPLLLPAQWKTTYPWIWETSLYREIERWHGFLDIVGLGAYPNYLFGTPQLACMIAEPVKTARAASGWTKPVMVVETGYPWGPVEGTPLLEQRGWSPELQARYVTQAAAHAKANGATGFIYYTLASDGRTHSDSSSITAVESYFGLVSNQPGATTESQAYKAFRQMLGKDPPDPDRNILADWGVQQLVPGQVRLTPRLSAHFREGTVLPEGEVALILGFEGGTAIDYGSSDSEFASQAGATPLRYGDVRILGTEADLGLVRIGFSINRNTLPSGTQSGDVRLYVRTGSWVEALNSYAQVVGDILTVFGDVSSADLLGTPICIAVRHFAGPPAQHPVSHSPNPVPVEGCIFWLALPNTTISATLRIYAVDGALLVTIPLEPTATRYPAIGRWQPMDNQGRLLGTGLYLYLVEIKHSDGKVTYTPVEKMVIQR